MKTMNKVQLIGYLGTDPDCSITATGAKSVLLSLATHHRKKGEDGKIGYVPTWHRVVAFFAQAYTAEQFQTGSHIMVEGYLVHRKYTSADGKERTVTEVRATKFIDLDR